MTDHPSRSPEYQAALNMTADTIGHDILAALVAEVRLLPDVWVKLSEARQYDVIERLRKRVEANVKMAVHLIASQGRLVVTADLESATIKDGVKAVFKVARSSENIADLFDAVGSPCLIVVAGHAEHTGGMDAVKGEPDQVPIRTEGFEPPGADDDDDGVVDGEVRALPAPGPDHREAA